MIEREDRSIATKIHLMISGILLFVMLSIVGVKEYVNYSIIKDENISKVFDNEKEKTYKESPKKEIVTTKKVKDEAYESIINIYESLFKDYMEQFEYCKKEEKRYEKERIQKQFDERVIVQQNKTLLTCYETLALTEEGLESTGKSLDGNYSQKISKEIKKMIEFKLDKYRININEK